jgi:hypothetical protein
MLCGYVHAQWTRATVTTQHPGWFQNKFVCSNAVCRFCQPEKAALRSMKMQVAIYIRKNKVDGF